MGKWLPGLLVVVVVPVGLAMLSGCNRTPNTLEECLLQANEKETAKAIEAATSNCQMAFPADPRPAGEAESESKLPTGPWFMRYLGPCLATEITESGDLLIRGDFRPIGRVERAAGGGLYVTLSAVSPTDRPDLFRLSATATGLRGIATSGPMPNIRFFHTQADCQLWVEARRSKTNAVLGSPSGVSPAVSDLPPTPGNYSCCTCLMSAKIFGRPCIPEGSIDCNDRLKDGNAPYIDSPQCYTQLCRVQCEGVKLNLP